jgi:hypothetical protein
MNTSDLKDLVDTEIDKTLRDTVKYEFGSLMKKFNSKRQEIR